VEEAYQDSRYELEDCEFDVNKIAGSKSIINIHLIYFFSQDAVEKSGASSALTQTLGSDITILKTRFDSFKVEVVLFTSTFLFQHFEF
jgi:hypothetical protein